MRKIMSKKGENGRRARRAVTGKKSGLRVRISVYSDRERVEQKTKV